MHFRGLLEGNDPGERKVHVQVQELFRPFRAPVVAVQNCPVFQVCFFQDLPAVREGVPGMDIYRQLQIAGNFNLPGKNFPLHIPGRLIPVVVQADFPDSDYLAAFNLLNQQVFSCLVIVFSHVRAVADDGLDIGKVLS